MYLTAPSPRRIKQQSSFQTPILGQADSAPLPSIKTAFPLSSDVTSFSINKQTKPHFGAKFTQTENEQLLDLAGQNFDSAQQLRDYLAEDSDNHKMFRLYGLHRLPTKQEADEAYREATTATGTKYLLGAGKGQLATLFHRNLKYSEIVAAFNRGDITPKTVKTALKSMGLSRYTGAKYLLEDGKHELIMLKNQKKTISEIVTHFNRKDVTARVVQSALEKIRQQAE